MQILRSALAGVDSYRQNFTSHHLNIASTIANDSEVSNNSDDRRRCLALARSSVSASFQDETYFAASLCGETGFVGDDDNKNTVGDGADETSRQQHLGQDLDVKMDQQGLHELSALQLVKWYRCVSLNSSPSIIYVCRARQDTNRHRHWLLLRIPKILSYCTYFFCIPCFMAEIVATFCWDKKSQCTTSWATRGICRKFANFVTNHRLRFCL